MEYIINPLIGLAFGVAMIYFLWGMFQYFFKKNDPKERLTGANHILWGIVGLVIMISAYGIINIVLNTIGSKEDFHTEYKTVEFPAALKGTTVK